MKMEKTTRVLLIAGAYLWLAISVPMFTHCWAISSEEQENAGEAVKKMMDITGEAASKSTDSLKSSAFEASEFASQKAGVAAKYAYKKAGDTKNYTSDKADQNLRMVTDKAYGVKDTMAEALEYGKDKIGAAENYVYEKADDTRRTGSEKISDFAKEAIEYGNYKMGDANKEGEVGDVKGEMDEEMEYGIEKANDDYEKAKRKVDEFYKSTRDSMTEQARSNYKTAKEEVSHAAGDLGAKMRMDDGEL